MYRRNTAVKRGGGQLPIVLDELAECISDGNNVEQEIVYRELTETIDTFLDTLSEKQRLLFIRRYWYTQSIADIARTQYRTQASVAMALSRIRKKLKNHLSERGF